MPAELLAFLGVAALVIVTPGQDTALTIRNTLLGGRTAGVATALGVSSGQAVWTLAASAGVAALIAASEPAFVALKLAGDGARIVVNDLDGGAVLSEDEFEALVEPCQQLAWYPPVVGAGLAVVAVRGRERERAVALNTE